METSEVNLAMKRALLALNCILLALGGCGGPLLLRLYFLRGGTRIWFSAWQETGGWPIIAVPLIISYFHRRKTDSAARPVLIKLPLFAAAVIIGILTGLDDYLYAYGVGYLPVSTSALIIASQLAFTAGFAYLVVKQKFTFYSMNAVVLLCVGSAVLALHSSGDRPEGVTKAQYYMGFFMTLGAAALYGFVLPLIELTYKKAKQPITYTLVMEIQFVMCFFATLFCTIGMIASKDFQEIAREAKAYKLGEGKYYVVVAWCCIFWQFFFLGAIGVIFCASSLLSGIIIAVLLPITETLGVLLYKEKFKSEKGVALVLSVWGFVSYFYGEIRQSRKEQLKKTQEGDLRQNLTA